MLPDRIETERLLLRPLQAEDLAYYVGLHGNPEVTRYLGGDGSPRSPEVTAGWLDRMRSWYRDDGIGPYAFVRRSDGALVGRGGLTYFEIESPPTGPDGVALAFWGKGSASDWCERAGIEVRRIVELGYVVDPETWGSGFATEASRAWKDYFFREWRESELYSLIHPENIGSIRVAEKNGMTRTTERLRMEGRDYDLYRITREEWRVEQEA